MWIFTPTGFVSAVQDWNDHDMVLVRARDAQSLTPLSQATGAVTTATPTADYPYRLHITKAALADWVRDQAAGVDYPNFKSQVAHTRGNAYSHALMDVWSAMHAVEDADARRPEPATDPGAVPSWVIDRIRQAAPDVPEILDDSTPIVSFGDTRRARVATIGINPATDAFTSSYNGPDGKVASPLLDRSALGARDNEPLSEEAAQRVAEACRDYFAHGLPHKWFLPFENGVLPAVKASYRNGTACHLDLVQWPTTTIWGTVPQSSRDLLITEDAWFLRRQLVEGDFEVLLLDGRSSMDTVSKSLGLHLECDQVVDAHSKASLKMYSGYAESTLVLAWNIPLGQAITTEAREQLATWLRDRHEIG